MVSIAFRRSALRLREPAGNSINSGKRLHCLSAFCPPATVVGEEDASFDAAVVSIAFRRSALRLRRTNQDGAASTQLVSIAFRRSALRLLDISTGFEPSASGLHCLSAFCPPATSLICDIILTMNKSLHCLSAFCPPATFLAPMSLF